MTFARSGRGAAGVRMGRWRRFLILHYYNDNCPKSCAWLRELIAAGQIPDGVVDERSILDVQPADVAGFVQCHFFAGIGGWSLALKLAGWPIGKPIWTGSCPCPPFSAAGKKKKCPQCGGKPIPHPLKTGIFACVPCGHEWFADARHLWPEFYRLIKDCNPSIVIGEQVAGSDGLIWLAGVRATLEALGRGVGCSDLCAAGVRSPHIRQRLYWVGHTKSIGWIGRQNDEDSRRRKLASGHSGAGDGGMAITQSDQLTRSFPNRDETGSARSSDGGNNGGLAHTNGGESSDGELQRSGRLVQQPKDEGTGGLEHSARDGREQRRAASGEWSAECGRSTGGLGDANSAGSQGRIVSGNGSGERTAGPSGLGFWDDYELIPCADGKQRRIEPGSKPLVASVSRGVVPGGDPSVEEAQNSGEARVMRLRGYGNAINTVTASEFIKAVMDCC